MVKYFRTGLHADHKSSRRAQMIDKPKRMFWSFTLNFTCSSETAKLLYAIHFRTRHNNLPGRNFRQFILVSPIINYTYTLPFCLTNGVDTAKH